MPSLKSVTYQGVTYTSASKLLSVLEINGVELFEDIFIGSGIGAQKSRKDIPKARRKTGFCNLEVFFRFVFHIKSIARRKERMKK